MLKGFTSNKQKRNNVVLRTNKITVFDIKDSRINIDLIIILSKAKDLTQNHYKTMSTYPFFKR